MLSQPLPGSSGDVLTTLPSAYLPHAATGLLHLPRFIAKCRYVKQHGSLPPSYAKNYKRGCDRFLSQHLGIEPTAVEKIVFESASDEEIEAGSVGDSVFDAVQLMPAPSRLRATTRRSMPAAPGPSRWRRSTA